MACNCGKKTEKVYVYTGTDGKETEHLTRLAANSAKIKAGGGGSIREVQRKK